MQNTCTSPSLGDLEMTCIKLMQITRNQSPMHNPNYVTQKPQLLFPHVLCFQRQSIKAKFKSFSISIDKTTIKLKPKC